MSDFQKASDIAKGQAGNTRKPDMRPATPLLFVEGDNFLLLHNWIHEWMVYAMTNQLNTFALQRMQQKAMEEQAKHTQAQRAAFTESLVQGTAKTQVGEKRAREEDTA